MKLFRRVNVEDALTLFFATDIHGSERCFRKFLNAASFYRASVLLMGGDLMGKMLVPITPEQSGWSADYGGRSTYFSSREEVTAFSAMLRETGAYPYECDEDELHSYQEQGAIEDLISRVALKCVQEWVELADTRLAGSGVTCLMVPGNDDLDGIDEILSSSSAIVNPDGRRVELPNGVELIATGWSNITPWNTPRELSEDDLEELMEGLFATLERPESAIASLHVPPFGSGLDNAPRLTDDLRIHKAGGEPEMVPVGSSAVRTVLERHQPLLGLHGHIHESHGKIALGPTVCVNPGSEYTEGVLRGAVIRIAPGRIVDMQFVRG